MTTDSDQRSVVESTNAPQGDKSPRARAVAPSSASIGPISMIMMPPHMKLPWASSTAPVALPRSPLNVITFGCIPVRTRNWAIGSMMNLKACLVQWVNELSRVILLAESDICVDRFGWRYQGGKKSHG